MMALANTIATAATGFFYFGKITPNLSNEIHSRLLKATIGATLSWITQTDTGVTLNRFSQDISIISQQLPIAFMQFCFILCSVATNIGILAAAAKYTAPVMLLILVLLYGIQYFYLRTSRQLRLLDLEASAPLLTLFKETSSGMQHIRAFRWQEKLMGDCSDLVGRLQKPYYCLSSVQQWLTLVLDLSACCIAAILTSISTKTSSISDTSVGLAFLGLISFSSLSSQLIRVWILLETCLGGLARIRTFCEVTPQEADQPDHSSVPDNWPSTGKVEIENVSASYE